MANKVSGDERLTLDRALSEAKDALKSGSVEQMNKAKEALTASSHKLAEAIYKEQPAKLPPLPAAPLDSPVGLRR